jgi:ketosteroid isomerase-like protein
VFKVMQLLKRRPGMTLEEFIERYESEHVPLAEKNITTLRRYARHYLHPTSHVIATDDEVREPEYDVITELWYDDRESYERSQEGLRAKPDVIAAVVADEERLFDRARSRTVYVEEHVSDIGREDDPGRTLRRLADKDEIVDLVHRYSFLVDHRRPEELMELFTDDCVVDYGPGVGEPTRSKAEFRAMFGGTREATESRPVFVATSHHNANVLVTFEGDERATVVTSLYAWHHTSTGERPELWGAYHDVVVRTAGGWKFASRQLRIAGNQGWDVAWHPLLP